MARGARRLRSALEAVALVLGSGEARAVLRANLELESRGIAALLDLVELPLGEREDQIHPLPLRGGSGGGIDDQGAAVHPRLRRGLQVAGRRPALNRHLEL